MPSIEPPQDTCSPAALPPRERPRSRDDEQLGRSVAKKEEVKEEDDVKREAKPKRRPERFKIHTDSEDEEKPDIAKHVKRELEKEEEQKLAVKEEDIRVPGDSDDEPQIVRIEQEHSSLKLFKGAMDKYKIACKKAKATPPKKETSPDRITGSSSSDSKTMMAKGEDHRWESYQEDLHILIEDDHCSFLSDNHKYACVARSFDFVRDMDGAIIDISGLAPLLKTATALYLTTTWHQYAEEDDALADIAFFPERQHKALLISLTNYWKKSGKAFFQDEKKSIPTPKTMNTQRKAKAARREATLEEKRQYSKQFYQAKLDEYKSRSEEDDIMDLIDVRKEKVQNYITRTWVLTIKRDKDGNFLKCKARWVLRDFQDQQVRDLQTDSPKSTRPGFRLQCQAAANADWDITHIDLKTAFLQGDYFQGRRDIVCQLPPEAGYPAYMGARLKRAAYGLNDAPRLWWNRLDQALRGYGLVPIRADRCCYVLYGDREESLNLGGDISDFVKY